MNGTQHIVTEFIARVNDAVTGGSADPFALVSNNAIVSVAGTTPISGVYRGLNQIKGVLLATAASRLKRIDVEIKEFVGSGERLAALLIVTGESAQGKAYNDGRDTSGAVFGAKDGKIVDIRLFPDTTLIETVLFDNCYVPTERSS